MCSVKGKCYASYRFTPTIFGEMRLNICRLSNMVDTQGIWKNTDMFTENELTAAISWKINIKKHKLNVSYEEFIEELSKIHEVEFTSKKSKIYGWTYISKDTEKMIKLFKVLDFQT